MNKASELSHRIVQTMKRSGMSVDVVHDTITEDSVVEHVTDLDVEVGNSTYNVRLTVIRFSTG
ncbi:hypothetical protein LCGC14_1101630 [marine sediment metagenome]|uniref:Uncharacterized protein n=1 Tax=marine sediment metagenome TaxID=412755 RepID=A0A0F9PSJ4_9ZZZZ